MAPALLSHAGQKSRKRQGWSHALLQLAARQAHCTRVTFAALGCPRDAGKAAEQACLFGRHPPSGHRTRFPRYTEKLHDRRVHVNRDAGVSPSAAPRSPEVRPVCTAPGKNVAPHRKKAAPYLTAPPPARALAAGQIRQSKNGRCGARSVRVSTSRLWCGRIRRVWGPFSFCRIDPTVRRRCRRQVRRLCFFPASSRTWVSAARGRRTSPPVRPGTAPASGHASGRSTPPPAACSDPGAGA